MNRRRDNERGGNDFGRNAESYFRELRNDPRFGGGWAHDWDSNPNQENGSYRGGPRRMHLNDDRDYSNREGHGYYADEQGGTVYSGGNRGRGDYGRSSSYGRRGYYDRGTYYEDAGRYTPRFHERREYDEYDRSEDLERNGRQYRNEIRDFDGFRARQRDGYDPRMDSDDRYNDRNGDRNDGRNDDRGGRRGDRSMFSGRDYDDRFGASYRDDQTHQHWYDGDRNRDSRDERRGDERGHDDHDRYRRNGDGRSGERGDRERRGFTPGDLGGQFGGRNTW
jgi:hypothetical protein